MTKALFFSLITMTAVATSANSDFNSSRGYRCEYSISTGEVYYVGYCEHESLSQARSMMYERASEVGGIPGACVPTDYVGNGCN